MSSINLGGIVGGGNGTKGLVSGLDSTKIIADLKAIRQKPIDDIQTKIDLNTSKTTKYSELNTLISNLKTQANYLRNPTGTLNKYSNAFSYRKTQLSSSTISSTENYVTVTAQPGALEGNSKISVGNIAKALEQRTNSFNARSTSATTSDTGAYFTAGTFQVGSAVKKTVIGDTASNFSLTAADYSITGSGTGILTGAGITAFNLGVGASGQTGLQGKISGFAATYNSGAGTITATVSINGVTYTSNAITANSTIGSDTGISSGTTITFTAGAGGANETSFSVQTASDIVINATQANADTFATNLTSALSGVSVYQSRRLENFVDDNVKSPLVGLTNSDVRFVSNQFNKTTGEIGEIKNFNVQYSTGSDGIVSVEINGERFSASGLGTTLNSSLTLSSATSDKELIIDFTGVSASISSESNADNVERALDYAFGTRELVDITVNSGDTLNDVVFSINQKSDDTGLSAGILKVNDFDFKLSLKASNVGIENKYEFFDTDGVLTHTNLLNGGSVTQSAEDAVLSIDGVEVKRSSNTISDVLTDVTINLLQETPNYGEVDEETINLNISDDVDAVTTAITNFVNTYNEIRVFNATQTQRNSETQAYTKDAILGGDNVLQTFVDTLLAEINNVISTGDSNFDTLSDIGITLEDFSADSTTPDTKNILTLDDTTLKSKLAANFDKLKKIFQLDFNSNSTSLTLYKSSNNFSLNSFKLDIDTSRGDGLEVKLLKSDGTEYTSNGQPVYLTYSGGKITGKSGTPVDGLEFLYSGDGTDIVSLTFTQGIADRVYNLADSYTKAAGIIETSVKLLDDQSTDYGTEKTKLQSSLDDYGKSLVAKYSSLESAIQKANSVLLYLDAQQNVNSNG